MPNAYAYTLLGVIAIRFRLVHDSFDYFPAVPEINKNDTLYDHDKYTYSVVSITARTVNVL